MTYKHVNALNVERCYKSLCCHVVDYETYLWGAYAITLTTIRRKLARMQAVRQIEDKNVANAFIVSKNVAFEALSILSYQLQIKRFIAKFSDLAPVATEISFYLTLSFATSLILSLNFAACKNYLFFHEYLCVSATHCHHNTS